MIGQSIYYLLHFNHFKTYLKLNKFAMSIKTWSPLHCPVMPFKLTDIGEGIREVTVKQWFVKPNQKLKQFEEVCEVESDKASVTITSRYDGEIRKIYYEEGDVVSVGSVLLDIETEESVENVETEIKKSVLHREIETAVIDSSKVDDVFPSIGDVKNKITTNIKALASPAVRRLAKEYELDIKNLKGTGKNERVLKEDILVYLNQPPKVSKPVSIQENVESITGYQKAMVKTMTESNRIPTLMLSDEVDVSNVETLRKNVKLFFVKENNVKLTSLSFVIKAVSLSLAKYPILNSTFDAHRNEVKYADTQNIGVAMSTPNGLVVPNIKNVQMLNILNISTEIQRLQMLAVETKLSIKDTTDGSFTISNIGSIAGSVFRPLILPPQVAIVAVGRIQALPRFDENDVIKKCSIMNLSWAADHRIIDGATVARFSNSVKNYLENPGLLIVDA